MISPTSLIDKSAAVFSPHNACSWKVVNKMLTRISRACSRLVKTSAPSQHYSSNSLWTDYDQAKNWLRCKKLPSDIDPHAVFCNNQIDLQEVEVYGFDYDYTLASYKKGVEYLIHDIAREHLVSQYGYPHGIGKIVYDPHFAIRGLHYDVEKGLFLKVDSSHQIQLGTVHRGRDKLTDKEVLSLYKRRQLPVTMLGKNNA